MYIKYEMNKSCLLLILIVLLFIPTVSGGIGFGPSEVYSSNQRDTTIVGKATLINGEEYSQYGVFSLFIPYTNKDTFRIVETEIGHARVVCNDCHASFQRNSILPGYKYGDPLEADCSSCGGHNLIFYKSVPRDELGYFSLEGAENFNLIPVEGKPKTWITDKKIVAGGACNINVLYDAEESYLKENLDQHWEIHLRGTAQSELGEDGGFMLGGIDLRVLISFKFPLFLNVPAKLEKGGEFTAKITYGDPAKTWEYIPENAYIVFNGISKPADENGCATFRVPDTRQDYEYTIEGTGDKYLSIIKLLSTGEISENTGENSDSFPYILITIAVILFVIIAIVIYLWWRR